MPITKAQLRTLYIAELQKRVDAGQYHWKPGVTATQVADKVIAQIKAQGIKDFLHSPALKTVLQSVGISSITELRNLLNS